MFPNIIGNYIFERSVFKTAKEVIGLKSNIVVHADLGNGKTLFADVLCCMFSYSGYRCYFLKDDFYENYSEIDYILSNDSKALIIIENYHKKMDLLRHIKLQRRKEHVLLLTARTSAFEASQESLYFGLKLIDATNTLELDLNKLTNKDLTEISKILDKYGLWGIQAGKSAMEKNRYLTKSCESELHAILLGILKSQHIQDKFQDLFSALNNNKYAKVAITCFVLSMINVSRPQIDMIVELANSDVLYSANFRTNNEVKQLFNISQGTLSTKSSILAEYALTHYNDTAFLLKSLIEIAIKSHSLGRTNRFYREIYVELVRLANIERMVPEKGRRDALIYFYEGLNREAIENNNPLFWLQYAMARLTYPDQENLQKSEFYLQTALSLAKKKSGFSTNDIETQYSRCLLLKSIHILTNVIIAFDAFQDAHSILLKVTSSDLWKREASRPARIYEQFYVRYKSELTIYQKKYIKRACEDILRNIAKCASKIADTKSIQYTQESLKSLVTTISIEIGLYE